MVLLFTMIHLLTGTAPAWLGPDVLLGLVIMLLVIVPLVALAALIYGFRLEKPVRRSARARRGSV
jgi:hypothetical protein